MDAVTLQSLIDSNLSVCVDETVIIDRQIKLRDGSRLYGNGSLFAADNLNTEILTNADPVNGNANITVEGLTFDGNRAGQIGHGGCMKFDNVSGLVVRNCRMSNAYNDNLFIDRCPGAEISGNQTHDAGTDCITVHRSDGARIINNVGSLAGQRQTSIGGGGIITLVETQKRLVVTGNVCTLANYGIVAYGGGQFFGSGIVAQECTDCVISGNVICDNLGKGFYSWLGDALTVSNNHCNGNGLSGIDCRTGGSIVSGNVCKGNGSHGIQTLSVADLDIHGNRCKGNGREGINCETASSNLNGNNINGNAKNGVRLSAQYCIVSGNQSNANGYYGVRNLGSNNVIVDNIAQFNALGDFS